MSLLLIKPHLKIYIGIPSNDKLYILDIPEGVEKQNDLENLFRDIIAENFPNLENDMEIWVQEAHWTPNRHNQRRSLRDLWEIKLSKVKHPKNPKMRKREMPDYF